MKPQNRILLILGRECLRLRRRLLDLHPFTVEYSETRKDLYAAWDIFKVAYFRMFSSYPRFQLRFY